MLRVGLGLLCALLITSCDRSRAGSTARRLALSPCRVEGVNREALCGKLEVFEDRAAKSGRKLSLNVAVIPALARDPAPDPMFLLAGGPGQAATEVMGKVSSIAFDRVMRRRDLVLVDQRGTGASNPLDCEETNPSESLAETLAARDLNVDALKKCLAGYDANPALYTTPIAMEDLDEVREALGYEKINLWGGSYGTRAALVYLRQFPERVRSLVLDGVAPVDMVLPVSFARDAQRALEQLIGHCEKDAACTKAYPNLGPRFQSLLTRLETTQERHRLEHPLSGREEVVSVSRLIFANGLRALLYAPETASLVPHTIDRAEKGDFGPFVAQSQGSGSSAVGQISVGMFYSVLCSEDMPLVTDALRVGMDQTFVGDAFLRQLQQACAIWPKGTLPAGYSEPVKSDKPVLLLSGDLDPVTPPRHAEEARKHLPNSAHFVVPGVGHGASYLGCMPRLIAEFVDRASPEGLDAKCLEGLKRPPFVTSFAGTGP